MMKMHAIVVLVGAVGLCTPAFAGPHQPTKLTQAEVDAVVADKRAELDACLAHLPAPDPHKKAVDIVLSLEIDDTGEVQTATVSNVPDDIERCIAVAAVEWEFPSTDVKADAATFACQLRGARPTVATRDAKPGQKPAAH